MKIKRIAVLVLAISLLCSMGTSAKTIEFTIGSNDMYVSDDVIKAESTDVAPYIENSRTLVPIRVVSEQFGAEVLWNDVERKVTIKSGDTVLELVIDSPLAILNGEEKPLDAPAVIKDGRTMVPLRFVSEALGKNVDYVDASKQILITDRAPALTIDGTVVSLEDVDVVHKYITYMPDDIEESVLSALDYFTQIVPIANDAKKNGFTLNESQKNELTDSVMNDKDIYYSTTLTAPFIKVLSDNLLARSYLDMLLEQYEIGDAYVNQVYESSYVRAKHILILTKDTQTGEDLPKRDVEKAKKLIEDIAKKVKKGEDFDALMKEYGQDPGAESQPDGYVFTYGEMVSEFENAAFALKEGEVSDIVETTFGYHIIKREALPEISEYIKMTIKSSLANELTTRIVQGYTDNADIKLVTPLEEIIKIFS